jgi:hypothetical protein
MITDLLYDMGVGPCASSSGIGWTNRNGGGRTADTIFHNRIERLGLGRNAAFWTGTRGGMDARLVAAFHSPGTGRTAGGRRIHYEPRPRQGSTMATHDIRR